MTVAPEKLSESWYVREFSCLAEKPPFRLSLSGVVQAVQPETTSQNGDAMVQFKLHDPVGRYVSCIAFGRHAANPNLQNGNEVVLFVASAQSGLNNKPGNVWMYDESHVLLLRTGCAERRATTCMQLLAC